MADADSGWTLHAKHDDGRDLTFNDYVPEGAQVDLFEDPVEEEGFLGACVVYRDDAGEWRARGFTEAERSARVDRLLKQVRRRDLPKRERLIDPACDAGTVASTSNQTKRGESEA